MERLKQYTNVGRIIIDARTMTATIERAEIPQEDHPARKVIKSGEEPQP
jgi:hypothetical protein